LSDGLGEAVREATIQNREGLHARPVMRFVDLPSRFRSTISVTNISKRPETVDGKSAMQMMLLEATQGSVLRIEAKGDDAEDAVEALAKLVESGFDSNPA
jgi:phosphotransferase system HPr (HPr) family protein